MKKQDDPVVQKSTSDAAALPKDVEDWKSKYLRALADYQNLERRVREDRQEQKDHSIAEIMHHVLLFFDEIWRAQKHLNDAGLAHAIKSFDTTFGQYRVQKIDVVHKEFNPHEMECVEVVSGNRDNEVMEEVRPGYKIGEKVLRVAWVKVSKKNN